MFKMHVISLPSYQIVVGSSRESMMKFIDSGDYTRKGLLIDENTEHHCLPMLSSVIRDPVIIRIKSGELNKQIDTCRNIWSRMVERGFDRHSLLINLGGGVIGDMGGFCASTYMRGIHFVQVPTTLLSQVDASIGGKLGIDFNGLKNLIGLFRDPKAIFVDPVFLATLPIRELRSGFAEIIKHALIADRKIWHRLIGRDWSTTPWETEIVASIHVKKNIVEKDPYESGQRKILNFGHSIGHALETLAMETHSPLLHGEAIALGMMCEAHLSTQKGLLGTRDFEAIINFLSRVFDDVHHGLQVDEDKVIEVMRRDKKNKDQKLLLSLIDSIGSCRYDCDIQAVNIKKSLHVVRDMLK